MKRVLIRFPSDRPYDYYTSVFYFAEKLYSQIVSTGLGQMDDIDRARDVLWIGVARPHDLGMVKKIVRKALDRDYPTDDFSVSVEDVKIDSGK